jgi:hypothetical protein
MYHDANRIYQRRRNTARYGSKYNIGTPALKNIKDLIFETENAIKQIDQSQQETVRYLAAKNLRNIISKHNYYILSSKN